MNAIEVGTEHRSFPMIRAYGLDGYRLKSMVRDKLQEQPDLFYYIEDPYVEKVANLVLDCLIEVVEKNNEKFTEDLAEEVYRLR
jgi:predicted house-cleaning noncanonical NTP pyrophosphatase (MazG superfamily)